MTDEQLLDELLSQTKETSELDFKREICLISEKDKFEFAKDVSAFANTNGGHIVYGKEDQKQGGRVVGIDPTTYNPDQMQQIIANRCNPPSTFRTVIIERDSKFFVIVDIPNSKSKPHEIIKTREVWIRRGGISDRATQRERVRMELEKEPPHKLTKTPLKEQLELEGVHEEPEGWLRKRFIKLGRWYALRTYGRLDVPLYKEIILLAVLGLLLFIPLAFSIYQITVTREVISTSILVPAVILAMLGIFPFLILDTFIKLRCPTCHRNFGVRRTEHIRVRDKILSKMQDRVIREVTYRNTYKCDYCDYSETKFENEEEAIRTD